MKMNSDQVNEEPILRLNGHCFYAIFDLLKLRDQYSFANTCQRIQDEYSSYLCWSQKLINLDDIQCKEFEDILDFLQKRKVKTRSMQISGPYFNEKRNIILWRLAKYYPNLIEFKVANFQTLCGRTLKKVTQTMVNLKVLTLSRCELNDVHCLYLQNCRMLETLDISENYVITGKYLNKFPKLEDLNLNYCRNIQPFYFIQLCKSSKLKHVHVAFCKAFNEVTFRGMLKYLVEVDTLTVSADYRSKKIHFLIKLPMLKNLEIHGIDGIKPYFYEQLLEHKSCTLERLTIIGSKQDMKLYKVEPIFNLSYLKYLSIKHMPAMNEAWLEKIADMDSLIYFNCAGCQNIPQDKLTFMILRLENLREVDISSCKQFNISLYVELESKLKCTKSKRKIILHVGRTNLMVLLTKDIKTLLDSKNVKLTSFTSDPVEHIRHSLFRKR